MALVSAAPVLALLEEPDYHLKEYALKSLDENVPQLWAEIANNISQIEELYEDPKFPSQKLAALVASKVYYNLGEFDTSMKYALLAGDKFDLTQKSEYIETIVSKCIDHYIFLSQKLLEENEDPVDAAQAIKSIDPALTQIVERMLKRCVDDGEFNLAIGVALDARRLDFVESIIKSNLKNQDEALELINYVLDCSINIVNVREFRNNVLRTLVPLIKGLDSPDYFAISKIIVQLNEATIAIDLFNDLLENTKNENNVMVAYQVAFDLVASASQELLEKVHSSFVKTKESEEFTKLTKILSGIPTCDYNLTFLKKHNNTDINILNKTKSLMDGRSSIFHNAVTFENAFLHAGTTSDSFVRNNLEWLGRATNWTKFTATAALGVIHQGNLTQARRILQPYFPGNTPSSCYTQGGSLYALGIIFAGHGREVLDYLLTQLVEGSGIQGHEDEVVLHGASLGLGVAGMGSGNIDVYEKLRTILYYDSAIAGEGAGLAMGLVMLGSASEIAVSEMLQYAQDTQHEKIIRSLAMGLALLMYGKEEEADSLIEQLITEQNPILRYGGAFTIALAYAGTGNNKAIKRLLHIAVSDASDDVRRASVISLGFILLRNYTVVPRMVELLSESHNPHVRYGTALALGISCAGTGLKDAVDVLEPMTKDPVDFVRQGALIAIAMILIQQNERTYPGLKAFNETFASVIQNKHEDAVAKFGAALAQGIIDAGGRNVTISLQHNQMGNLNMKAVVGLAVFTQYWYWFPLTHFLSLSFTPTTIVGVKEDLYVPDFDFVSSAKPKLFAYPPKIEEASETKPEKLETAILSTTNRVRTRAKKLSKAKEKKEAVDSKKPTIKTETDDKMEIDEEKRDSSVIAATPASTTASTSEGSKETIEKVPTKSGRKYNKVENMSRVVPAQLKYISFEENSRYVPVRKLRGSGGVVIVKDLKPDEPAEMIVTVRQKAEEESGEAPLPRPFTYESDGESNEDEEEN